MTPQGLRQRILVTGPGGRVGTHLVPLLRSHYALRLFDAKELEGEGDDEVLQGDIQDFEAIKRACVGVEAMIHLAAVSDEDDFLTKLLPMNIVGLHHAFEAARLAGVRKVIYASTGQTVLNYPEGEWVTPEMPVRPSTVYACTKVFGEALARYYSEHFGMAMICIRLCWFQGYDSPLFRTQPDMYRKWCSPRDLTQLLVKCLETDLKFGIFFGISNNTGRYLDVSNGEKLLGYHPQDDAFEHVRKHFS